ncbi:MAG TPA: CPXCG motif-containing cysteine-rich protein [Flavobacteriaceae bacterium]|nr:CPXCG motif-containing cysteine-rich protein [Flavobacteriaceae bacterium]
MLTHNFNCPYCWQEISVLIDTSIDEQHYIEDCENCCNPIEINLKIRNKQLVNFSIQKSH